MACVLSTQARIQIEEYNRATPPGWQHNLASYGFRMYLETLQLWRTIIDTPTDQRRAVVVGRLKQRAYRVGMKLNVNRTWVTHTAPHAVNLPAEAAIMGPDGTVAVEPKSIGLRPLSEHLRENRAA